jgi:DNA-binding LytR/AlgR family response regulator
MFKEPLKILVVEDDALIAEDIMLMLEDMGMISVGKAFNARQALNIIRDRTPDLILLDIELEGDMDGIELGEMINKTYHIPFIYITSYYDDATVERAKKSEPEAYILKPFNENDLKVGIQLATTSHSLSKSELSDNKLFVKVNNGLKAIEVDDICFINSDDNYCFLYHKEGNHIVHRTLKKIKAELKNTCFVQVHRSYLVNFKKITHISEDYMFIDEYKIPIGKTYRTSFFDLLKVI